MRGWIAALALTFVAPLARAQAVPAGAPAEGPLALRTIEARPCFGWSFAPSSATGAFVGADVAWRISPVLAIAADGAWYGPFNAGRGSSPTYPLNESDLSVDLDLALFPLARARGEAPDKLRGEAPAGGEAGAFEPYGVGGIGVTRNKPIAVVDPSNRTFDWNNYINFEAGVGGRIFALRTLAVSLELRDVLYYEKLESRTVATGSPGSPSSPKDPTTWYDRNTHFVNDVQIRLGVGFFFGGGGGG